MSTPREERYCQEHHPGCSFSYDLSRHWFGCKWLQWWSLVLPQPWQSQFYGWVFCWLCPAYAAGHPTVVGPGSIIEHASSHRFWKVNKHVLSLHFEKVSVYAPMIKAAIISRGFICTSLTWVISGTIRSLQLEYPPQGTSYEFCKSCSQTSHLRAIERPLALIVAVRPFVLWSSCHTQRPLVQRDPCVLHHHVTWWTHAWSFHALVTSFVPSWCFVSPRTSFNTTRICKQNDDNTRQRLRRQHKTVKTTTRETTRERRGEVRRREERREVIKIMCLWNKKTP